MHRLIRFAIVPLVVLAAFVAFEQSATAHERREVLGGKYQFVVGWRDEPAISNELNSIDLRVTDLSQATPAADSGEATGAPVEGLDMTLTADVIYIDQTRTLELEPRFGQPGAYNGWVIPVQPGDYAFHILFKVRSEGDDPAVDAGLDFAAEELLPGVLPAAAVPHQRHRPAYAVGARIDAETMQ